MKRRGPEYHAFLACFADGALVEATAEGNASADAGSDEAYEAFVAGMDVLVLGRPGYEAALATARWPYALPVVVLSAAVAGGDAGSPAIDTVSVVSGRPSVVTAVLAAQGARRAGVAGGETVRRFLAAGLVSTLTLARAPRLGGSGQPLVEAGLGEIPLLHLETIDFPSGVVQSVYAVGGAG